MSPASRSSIRPGPNHLLDLASKPSSRSERDEETLGDDFMARHGYEVVRFSQPRNTMQTEGIPDRRYYHAGWGHALWWEAKAQGGRQRPRQRWFQQMSEACGEEYVLGTADALIAHVTRRLVELRRRQPTETP